MGNKYDRMKICVIIILLLFVGSSIGLGILMMPSSNTNPEIPKSMVVSSLTPQQEQTIIKYGGTIIYFEHEPSCRYCSILLDRMEGALSKLRPYVFIVYKESDATLLRVVNVYGEKSLTSGGLKDLLTFVCTAIPPNTKQHDICLDLVITVKNESLMNASYSSE